MSPSLSDAFAGTLRSRGLSDNTVRAYCSDLSEFESWVENALHGAVTPSNFDFLACQWLNEFRDDWSPKTVQRRMTALRTFARHANWEASNLGQYRAPSPARPVPHPIAEGVEGVKKMLVVCPTVRHRALIALCALGGLRCNEARTLPPTAIDLQDKIITIMGKGSRQRRIPMSDTLWKHLKDAHALAEATGAATMVGLSDRQARQAITDIAKRAGIKNHISSHDLRATFATAVYGATRDLRATQELLGHANSKQTEVYTDVPMDRLRKAAVIL